MLHKTLKRSLSRTVDLHAGRMRNLPLPPTPVGWHSAAWRRLVQAARVLDSWEQPVGYEVDERYFDQLAKLAHLIGRTGSREALLRWVESENEDDLAERRRFRRIIKQLERHEVF